MIDCDDYFCGLTREEYEKEMEEHFKFIDHICKCDYDKAFALIDKYKDNLFATEFVSDEEAEMIYHTILNWKEKSEMYDDLCDWKENKYMSKAMLVMDMPDSCLDCRFCREIDEGIEACCEIMDEPDDSSLCRMIDDYCQCRPSWCPLKEIPKKSCTGNSDYYQWGDWEDGWNACIDELLGE